MSFTSCTEFLSHARRTPELNQQFKAMTEVAELVALGGRHGFEFDAADVAAVSNSTAPSSSSASSNPTASSNLTAPERPAAVPPEPAGPRTVFHHEFDLDAIPEMAAVARELDSLTVRPSRVDPAAFDRGFDAGDRATLDRPPEGPAFARHQDGLRERTAAGGGRPDFHLVDLDEHVDDPAYPAYFAAKQRVVGLLEDLFDDEIRCSGNMWYPPGAYRLWHTNENQPGWRMYIVALDGAPPDDAHTPFFRYRNPVTGAIVTLPERGRTVRFFRAEQDPGRLFWHGIANPGPQHRWSFGFVVPPGWRDRFPAG